MKVTDIAAKVRGAALIPAAGYIRMSTDKQEDSPERQRREINLLADREGCKIVAWYEDHGKTGTESSKRKDFQRLLVDASAGKFRMVLVHEQSRFSREKVLKVFGHFAVLDELGVTLATTRRGRINFDDIGDMVTTLVEAHGARAESVRMADRSLSGKLCKASRGQRFGRSPYAYDRQIFDESQAHVKTVGYYDRFTIPRLWSSRLVPSSNTALTDAVQFAYKTFLATASLLKVAREFNQRGLRTYRGKPFRTTDIKRILANPVYAGVYRFGHAARGQFARADGETILQADHHPALVTPHDFQAAQVLLAGVSHSRTSTEPGRFLLSGLLVCGQCGNRMYGSRSRSSAGPGYYDYYRCMSISQGYISCPGMLVRAEFAERATVGLIIDALTKDTAADAIAVASITPTVLPALEAQQIAELEIKLTRAQENMALAEGANFAAIANLCDGWRQQIEALKHREQEAEAHAELTEEEQDFLRELATNGKIWASAKRRVVVAALFKRAVRTIRLFSEVRPAELRSVHRYSGAIAFYNGLPDAEFLFDAPRRELGSNRVARLVASKRSGVTIREMAVEFGNSYRMMQHHVRLAVKAGAIRTAGSKGCAKLYVAT